MTTIVSLIGQQPIPNLLPIKYVEPEAALLVYSDFTADAANRLSELIKDQLEVWPVPVDAYAILETSNVLTRKLSGHYSQPDDLIFNLTGGTKAMSLAAYKTAVEIRAPFIYLQSEGSQSRLYHYNFDNGDPALKETFLLPALINIDDYLRAYVGSYTPTGFAKDPTGRQFEQAIYATLDPAVDEIVSGAKLLGALDVDFVIRCNNQVGIIEAKTGRGVKKGIDQLNTAGGQQYLGMYTKKFLISDQVWDHSLSNLKELAEARRIQVIELPSYAEQGSISQEDADKLRVTVSRTLGKSVH